jgi:hypothetical protein
MSGLPRWDRRSQPPVWMLIVLAAVVFFVVGTWLLPS